MRAIEIKDRIRKKKMSLIGKESINMIVKDKEDRKKVLIRKK